MHKISNWSENDEENENYAMQDYEILNTKEATANFCFLCFLVVYKDSQGSLGSLKLLRVPGV